MVILVPLFNRCQDDFEYFSGYFHYLHFIRWQQWLPVNKNEKILKVGVGKLSPDGNYFFLLPISKRSHYSDGCNE